MYSLLARRTFIQSESSSKCRSSLQRCTMVSQITVNQLVGRQNAQEKKLWKLSVIGLCVEIPWQKLHQMTLSLPVYPFIQPVRLVLSQIHSGNEGYMTPLFPIRGLHICVTFLVKLLIVTPNDPYFRLQATQLFARQIVQPNSKEQHSCQVNPPMASGFPSRSLIIRYVSTYYDVCVDFVAAEVFNPTYTCRLLQAQKQMTRVYLTCPRGPQSKLTE